MRRCRPRHEGCLPSQPSPRSRSSHRVLVRVLVTGLGLAAALGACSSSGLPPGDGSTVARDLAGAADLATGGGPDLAKPDLNVTTTPCEQIDECTCLALSRCRPVGESCYCPYPQCGTGECFCAGGRFFGCADPGCSPTLACSRAATITRDGKRCPACVEPTTCEQGIAALKASCNISDALLSAFSCATGAACKLACIRKVSRCDDVGCGLCAVCGCSRVGPFEQCVAACG